LAEQRVESQGELTEFRDLGDQVLGLGRLSFRSPIGVDLDSEVACTWRWSEGKCVEARTWLNHAEALEAAGLSEYLSRRRPSTFTGSDHASSL
jgi:hypothetical protein